MPIVFCCFGGKSTSPTVSKPQSNAAASPAFSPVHPAEESAGDKSALVVQQEGEHAHVKHEDQARSTIGKDAATGAATTAHHPGRPCSCHPSTCAFTPQNSCAHPTRTSQDASTSNNALEASTIACQEGRNSSMLPLSALPGPKGPTSQNSTGNHSSGKQQQKNEAEKRESSGLFSFEKVEPSVAPGTMASTSPMDSPTRKPDERLALLTGNSISNSIDSFGAISPQLSLVAPDLILIEQLPTTRNLTVPELNDEIQELTWIGQGASGDVYKGLWRGAPVAVKYVVTPSSSTQQAAANEAVLAKLLAHPNVVQTFSCKVAITDDSFFYELNDLVRQHQPQPQPNPGGDLDHWGAGTSSFISGEGFGNPLSRPANVVALQEVLHRANAKPGDVVTQIVMEHCDKGSLLQAIKRGLFRPNSKWGSKLALRALLRTGREVAQGMWHIHSSNVIHGDLKPGNVLLKGSRADRRGFTAKVSDFGLARVCDRTTVDSAKWGTVHYMSPEAFDGVVTRAADVYSFGVMLWQMHTGDKPYMEMHPGQIIVGVQTGSLTLQWPPDTCAGLVKLGDACMEFDRKKRPTFKEIMKELSLIESVVRMEGTRDAVGSADRISTSNSRSHLPSNGSAEGYLGSSSFRMAPLAGPPPADMPAPSSAHRPPSWGSTGVQQQGEGGLVSCISGSGKPPRPHSGGSSQMEDARELHDLPSITDRV